MCPEPWRKLSFSFPATRRGTSRRCPNTDDLSGAICFTICCGTIFRCKSSCFSASSQTDAGPSCNKFHFKARKAPPSSTVLQIPKPFNKPQPQPTSDDGELEDLAPLPLGPVVEVQDPAALPQDPELLWSHVLRQRRCHLFQCILRILSILLCLVRHHLVLLLCLEQQLQRRNHHRLCLLRCHRATHDHK